MFKALELIHLIHVLIHNYVRDEVTKEELLQQVDAGVVTTGKLDPGSNSIGKGSQEVGRN